MKIQRLFIIAGSLLLILFATYFYMNTKDDELFRLTINNPQKILQKGDKVTFTARLTNLTGKKYTIYHGAPLICLYIRNKGDETPAGIYSMKVKSVMKPHGYIEQTLNIEALEAGEYVLKAYTIFKAKNKEYNLKCEDILITVTDN
ncbi:hypothetical protein [Anaerocolumna jejuensis]|uniref:hypothetical protein n=1 Tax=Anaerocolumna jejuensis TaxID=259063 RepID=UPI003F7CA5FB